MLLIRRKRGRSNTDQIGEENIDPPELALQKRRQKYASLPEEEKERRRAMARENYKHRKESERCLGPSSTYVVITTEATLAQNDDHPGQSSPCGNTIFKDENMMSNINFSDTNDIGIASENGDVWLQEMVLAFIPLRFMDRYTTNWIN
ncbi:hypothetical protein PVAP13_1NG284200 [Panicum virgatum]|uniref:Uncharacterized protein n=1 Tax=Panicum virgatum TaxID=38727 RepID=A0A8T0X258_PANVG|nr:hypothetical protein PVAP13_1NG284200 [Panicum virgatum]